MENNNTKIVKNDIMRYKSNKLASGLALLGLAFGCLYFLIVYAQFAINQYVETVRNFFYRPQLGFSVIINLVFLLMVFFCSEEVKAYHKKFAYVLIVIAAIQIGRIFYYPMQGYQNDAMPLADMIVCIVFLSCSAACLIASAVVGLIRANIHDAHIKAVESGEVVMDEVFAAEEAQDAAEASDAATAEVAAEATPESKSDGEVQ